MAASDQSVPTLECQSSFDTFVALASQLFEPTKVSTIVEVGARDCAEALAFAEEFPNARIFTFECNPATLPSCEKAVSGNPRVTLIPKAVAETEGTIPFFQFTDENPGASSLYRFNESHAPENAAKQTALRVEATTLHRFMSEYRLDGIDLLWMDIQGAELAALRGFGARLRQVGIILTEVEFYEIYADQPLFWKVWAYLRRHGFILHGFPWRGLAFGDAVFINARMLGRKERWRARVQELRALRGTIMPLVNVVRRSAPD